MTWRLGCSADVRADPSAGTACAGHDHGTRWQGRQATALIGQPYQLYGDDFRELSDSGGGARPLHLREGLSVVALPRRCAHGARRATGGADEPRTPDTKAHGLACGIQEKVWGSAHCAGTAARGPSCPDPDNPAGFTESVILPRSRVPGKTAKLSRAGGTCEQDVAIPEEPLRELKLNGLVWRRGRRWQETAVPYRARAVGRRPRST